ncbi:hypothetical protein RRF57_010187 [Xylaria bambusicola]|uniref:Uncharacterized protein n=1 Tax=Xylaria bambusicola TaxID=326684 RepID=A0AAN7V3E0_9PEZI
MRAAFSFAHELRDAVHSKAANDVNLNFHLLPSSLMNPTHLTQTQLDEPKTSTSMQKHTTLEAFETKLRMLANLYRERFGHVLQYDSEDEIRRFREYRPKLAGFCIDAVHLVQNMQNFSSKFLVEGHSALILDVNYGMYPWLAIHPKKIDILDKFPIIKESLPQQAQAYVKLIEEHCGVSVA